MGDFILHTRGRDRSNRVAAGNDTDDPRIVFGERISEQAAALIEWRDFKQTDGAVPEHQFYLTNFSSEQRRRFLTPGAGYQPGNAQMFYGNK